jgi:cell division protein FtsQ
MTVLEKADRFTDSDTSTHWRRWAILGVLLGAVAAGVYAVYFSSFLVVHQERVLGAVHVSSDAVRQAAAVPPGIQLARVDSEAVAQRVGTLGWVKSVEVRRGWPDVLVIVVTERVPVAVVPVGQGFSFVDGSGAVFETIVKPPPSIPVLMARDATSRQTGSAVLSSLPSAFRSTITRVVATSRDNVLMTLPGPSYVQWGSAQDSDRKYAVLSALLHLHARAYNVSAPDLPTTRGTLN